MAIENHGYEAILSSDWNECLAPCGPFDPVSFNHPGLAAELEAVFKQYTGNEISLGRAARRVRELLPAPLTEERMDAFLDDSFDVYKGAPELVEWCFRNNILFMINTTGMMGYFQRMFAKGLFPPTPALSAHPMIRYDRRKSDPRFVYELAEIEDKAKNTEAMARSLNIPFHRIILMGDSGGDGPHFEWGAGSNALLIGSMTKPSLEEYCRKKGVEIHVRVGPANAEGEKEDPQGKPDVNLMDVTDHIEAFLEK